MAVTESALVSQNGALLTLWLKLCTNINTVRIGVAYTKSVRESEQTSDISSQSSKSLFRKKKRFSIRFAYSALPLFYFFV